MLLVEVDDDEFEDVMDMVLRESMVRPIPATRSAMERLKKVTFEDGLWSIRMCIICKEEFEDGLDSRGCRSPMSIMEIVLSSG
jgi:hypothetical protein